MRIVSPFVIVACREVFVAGSGSSGGGSSTPSATEWASGYCGAATAWVTTLESARASVRPGNPSATASDPVQQVTNATHTFIQAISGLGAPDTHDGSTTQATATNLSKTLQGRVARASAAINSNNPDLTEVLRAATVKPAGGGEPLGRRDRDGADSKGQRRDRRREACIERLRGPEHGTQGLT